MSSIHQPPARRGPGRSLRRGRPAAEQPAVSERRADPAPTGGASPLGQQRAAPGPADLGPDAVIHQGPEGRPQADQHPRLRRLVMRHPLEVVHGGWPLSRARDSIRVWQWPL